MKLETKKQDSSSVTASLDPKTTKPRMLNAMSYAHYLGLDFPKAKTAAKTISVTASEPRKPAANLAPSATRRAPSKTTAAAPKAAIRNKCAMPFSEALGLTSPAPARRPEGTTDTLRFPEMAGGVATGRYLEVDRPRQEAPKLDSSSIANRILAVAKRVFGK